jgi:hypothetical protein
MTETNARHSQLICIRGANSVDQWQPKRIAYDQEAREAILRGVKKLARAVKVTLGPRAATSSRKILRLAHRHQGRRHRRQGNRTGRFLRKHGRADGQGSRLQDQHVAGDGTTTATVYAEAIFAEGMKNVASGANPRRFSAASRPGRRSHRRRPEEDVQEGRELQGSRPGRRQLAPIRTSRSAR